MIDLFYLKTTQREAIFSLRNFWVFFFGHKKFVGGVKLFRACENVAALCLFRSVHQTSKSTSVLTKLGSDKLPRLIVPEMFCQLLA